MSTEAELREKVCDIVGAATDIRKGWPACALFKAYA